MPAVASAEARAMVTNPVHAIPCVGIPSILAEHKSWQTPAPIIVLDVLNGGRTVLA